MNHRLFHTLVLSGVALVEGCASTPPPPAAAPTQSAQATAPTTPAEPAPTTTAEPPPVAAAPVAAAPSADEVRAILADARACSPGWPTTKSANLYPPRNVALNGRTYACVVRPDRDTQCCERAPAP